jgi:hypothetical protein
MLPDNLTANQIKNRSGTEREFAYVDGPGGRSRIYKDTTMPLNLPCYITVQHRIVGKGLDAVRQSNITIDKTVVSATDPTKTVHIRESRTKYVPEAHISSMNDTQDVSAFMNSFCATDGTGTTVLFAGTGLGTEALDNGTL